MLRRFLVAGAFAAAIILVLPSHGNAQNSLVVDHFNGPTDQTYDFVNYGLQGASETPGQPFPGGWECANIYLYFREEIVACGGCEISPNGASRISLSTIRGNPITGVVPPRGVVKILYSGLYLGTPNFGSCNPTIAAPRPGLKTFRTRLGSEIELAEVGLSASELSRLHTDCAAVENVGSSGPGIISCPDSNEY